MYEKERKNVQVLYKGNCVAEDYNSSLSDYERIHSALDYKTFWVHTGHCRFQIKCKQRFQLHVINFLSVPQ